MSDLPPASRPKSVFWAGVLFWVLSLCTFGTHIGLARKGVADIQSYLFAGVVLMAALLAVLRPRARTTFYVGVLALTLTVIRGAFTARTQYLLRTEFPNILPQVIFSSVLAAAVAWLTYRFALGPASRRYFDLQ